ncbi:hypothetical protein HMPREF3038_00203 [Akkermansia sp. KLE1797]|nr:hypothetical protein HMPREF3038_00203 [Akkermansia sp. KLE1797]KXU52771.1 hypothetical protein HMPREF3039_03058 [Akkermansia sp. KLE1798]KZA04533.1 hypothetical protein HMPREF1326_01778 [Akkermansia sp. KLE1605]
MNGSPFLNHPSCPAEQDLFRQGEGKFLPQRHSDHQKSLKQRKAGWQQTAIDEGRQPGVNRFIQVEGASGIIQQIHG